MTTMPNDPFTPIRQRLLAVLANCPDTIVPVVAKDVVTISAYIVPDMSVTAIEEAIVDLTDLSKCAESYGRFDIADELDDIGCLLRNELPSRVVEDEPKDSVFYISFACGTITGNYAGHTVAEVSDSLLSIVAALQLMDDTPDHTTFKGGVACAD